MFYLKQILKLSRYYPFFFFNFVLVVIGLLFICSHRDYLEEKYIEVNQEKNRPAFSVLYRGAKDWATIAQKLDNLPGVKKVKRASSDQVQKKQREIFTKIGLTDSSILDNEVIVFKIWSDSSLPAEGLGLMREFVKRYLGEGQTSITQMNQQRGFSFPFLSPEVFVWISALALLLLGLTPFLKKFAFITGRFHSFRRYQSLLTRGVALLIPGLAGITILFSWLLKLSPDPAGLIGAGFIIFAYTFAIEKWSVRQHAF